MGAWYWIGVCAGIGAAIGIGAAAVIPRWIVAAAVAALAAAAIGIGLFHWEEAVAGLAGGLAGGFGATPVVAGSLRRGGTRGGLAAIVGLVALAACGLAFVPAAGYLEALALPALALRARRSAPERYAGLRTLARD